MQLAHVGERLRGDRAGPLRPRCARIALERVLVGAQLLVALAHGRAGSSTTAAATAAFSSP